MELPRSRHSNLAASYQVPFKPILHIQPANSRDFQLPNLHIETPRQPAMASSLASRRLFQEYRTLTSSPPEGITAGPVSEDDIFTWEALIQGPEGTPFEGGIFPAELKFPKDYPLNPPSMKFTCDIWHPNG